ncbi:Protein of unknown function DUF1778 [Burkholderia ambifaria IOP40-10]|uniref:DUF1778 domain-containing protein n=1 Tax=Burkholderia ambifaria IOP40-10 TaxID=396596 RepID=B1FDZ0_9BURK|nr:DUF1778 domain-containing protein [Burkholderia ambifaria]EDT04202.1 Protein of unknown function DUF1778 [Burkholderia ambifaria IOP40-10]
MATIRFEARIESGVHATIARAAEIQGRTIADFVIFAACEAAQKAIAETEVIRLSMSDSRRFANALISPPELADALKRAIADHDRQLRDV